MGSYAYLARSSRRSMSHNIIASEAKQSRSFYPLRLRSFGFAPETPLRFASGARSETGDFAQDRRRPIGLLVMTRAAMPYPLLSFRAQREIPMMLLVRIPSLERIRPCVTKYAP